MPVIRVTSLDQHGNVRWSEPADIAKANATRFPIW
jgi:hypothetical protein